MVTGAVQLWMVVALAFGLGISTAIDNPVRQSFAQEMVGPARVRNAVTLNSVLVNVGARGRAGRGRAAHRDAGTGVCFLVNAVSYVAVLAALLSMDVAELRAVAARGAGPRPGARGASPTWAARPTCWCR